MTILARKLFNEACDSPLSARLLAEMFTARLVYNVTKHDPDAGRELYAGHPLATRAVAAAEAASLTTDEQRELVGELPNRLEEYNARAWTLIDQALGVLELPQEIVESITGDMLALFAAALLVKDVRDAADNEAAQSA